MDLELKGKYALVTGGSHGIGRAIALALAEEGCHVAICARNKERVDRVVREIKSRKVKALGIIADVMVSSDIDRVMRAIIAQWKTLHILINNVGGGGRWGSDDVLETSEQVWMDVFSKNTLAAVRFTTRALPYMCKQKWGRVVTISSVAGREAGERPWYVMAKSSEITVMKSLAMDKKLVRKGVTFNTIAPGAIMIPDTGWDAQRKKNLKNFKKTMENFPLGRPGTPEEVAQVVVFACSEKASLLNGACIPVDGSQGKSF